MLSTQGIYQNLQFAVKNRFLDEIQNAFDQFPAFSGKTIVTNKFPYNERIQFGVVLRNSSATLMRMSPDNFIQNAYSAVRIARQTTFPGLAIEWVRENTGHISITTEEDVSNQLGPTQRRFYTSQPILMGPNELNPATDPREIKVTINGCPVMVESVNGEKREVTLYQSTNLNDVVKVTYYMRNLVPQGLYFINFITDNQFTVSPVYIVDYEVLIKETTGAEATAQIKNYPLDHNSEEISVNFLNGRKIYNLIRNVDYSIDYTTGLITFLKPLVKNYKIVINYRYQPQDYINGPYTINEYQENHTVLPGIVFSVGRRAKQGDQQVIIVSKNRVHKSKIYGGHWDMSLEAVVISKDPLQMAQMADHLVSYLWGERKNVLEFEGITLNSVEPSGESEENFIDTTGDLYYEVTISISVMTEWQRFVPILDAMRLGNINLIPELKPVIKVPLMGYNKLD